MEDGERGAALALVLWLIVAVGVLAAALLDRTRYEADALHAERCRLAGSFAARAGLVTAADRIRDLGISAGLGPEAPVPGRGEPARDGLIPGEVVRQSGESGSDRWRAVGYDVSSRLNVNRASPTRLATLLAATGVPADSAGFIADAVRDWIDPDSLRHPRGAEAAAYRSRPEARLPRNGPVPTLRELAHVRGMTRRLLFGDGIGEWGRAGSRAAPGEGGLARFLTVEGTGRINLNRAPPEVLATLPGFTPEVVRAVLEVRSRRPIRSLSDLARHPSLRGHPALEAAGNRLRELVLGGSMSEGIIVRSSGHRPGCAVGAEVRALLAPTGSLPLVGRWSERRVGSHSPLETGDRTEAP